MIVNPNKIESVRRRKTPSTPLYKAGGQTFIPRWNACAVKSQILGCPGGSTGAEGREALDVAEILRTRPQVQISSPLPDTLGFEVNSRADGSEDDRSDFSENTGFARHGKFEPLVLCF